MQNNYILEMRNITKEFLGVKALDSVDFCVRPGTVHAVVGENGAGKSTLMKIICGMYSFEQGEYLFRGELVEDLTPIKGLEMGIAMIQQELSPVPEMTIAENIYLGREPVGKLGFIDYSWMERQAHELLLEMELDIDTRQKMHSLTTAGAQMVEIVKATSRNASLIIMDEPTSSISDKEIASLFKQIRRLKEKGAAIIYITHKLDEVFAMADEITVMRDGHKISHGVKNEYTMDRMIKEMVGRELTNVYPAIEYEIGREMLKVEHLSGPGYEDVSFEVRAGEIVGFSGLVGAGRTELMSALFGLNEVSSGKILLEGEPITVHHPLDAIRRGFAMATEDRKVTGLVLCRSIRENISLANMDKIRKNGLINTSMENEIIQEMVERMNVRLSSVEQSVSSLSGGNQQKVVLAKWMARDLKVMILDEPTRGIDVGAKYEIYTMIGQIARKGIAVIVISSEIPELLGICSRICVMSQGKITGNFIREEATQEEIMKRSVIGYSTEQKEHTEVGGSLHGKQN